EDCKLVATDTGELVVRTHGGCKRVGQPAQLGVPERVAVRVVQRLQVVKVAEQEQERRSVCASARERLVEDPRVENAREEVAVGELFQAVHVPEVLVRKPADECSA